MTCNTGARQTRRIALGLVFDIHLFQVTIHFAQESQMLRCVGSARRTRPGRCSARCRRRPGHGSAPARRRRPRGGRDGLDHLVLAQLLAGHAGHAAALAPEADDRRPVVAARHLDHVVDVVAVEPARSWSGRRSTRFADLDARRRRGTSSARASRASPSSSSTATNSKTFVVTVRTPPAPSSESGMLPRASEER